MKGQPLEAGRVGSAPMHRLLQTEHGTPKPWHETGGEPRRVVALVQRTQCLVPGPHNSVQRSTLHAAIARRAVATGDNRPPAHAPGAHWLIRSQSR